MHKTKLLTMRHPKLHVSHVSADPITFSQLICNVWSIHEVLAKVLEVCPKCFYENLLTLGVITNYSLFLYLLNLGETIEQKSSSLCVLNRWGNNIFKSSSPFRTAPFDVPTIKFFWFRGFYSWQTKTHTHLPEFRATPHVRTSDSVLLLAPSENFKDEKRLSIIRRW